MAHRTPVLYTVGHSTRASAELIALLRAHGVEALVDVRRFPGSRRHPQFQREALADALAAAGIAYRHDARLGGRRQPVPGSPNTAWRNDQFRGYADHMASAEFRAALADLLGEAAARPTTVMCAEAVPWRCHRQLIADLLVVRGIEVLHVTGRGRADAHRLTPFARPEGDRVVYDRGVPGTLASRSRADRP
jgi:uncharacterized protein (DUF488 family)